MKESKNTKSQNGRKLKTQWVKKKEVISQYKQLKGNKKRLHLTV